MSKIKDQNLPTSIWWFYMTLLLLTLVTMKAAPLHGDTSNFSQWWALIGTPPDWVKNPDFDYKAEFYLDIFLIPYIIWIGWLFIRSGRSRIGIILSALFVGAIIFHQVHMQTMKREILDIQRTEKLHQEVSDPDRAKNSVEKASGTGI
jgi:hypothetical protein